MNVCRSIIEYIVVYIMMRYFSKTSVFERYFVCEEERKTENELVAG